MMLHAVRTDAGDLRSFLEPLWVEWHQDRAAAARAVGRRYENRCPSFDMCGFTAFFAMPILRESTGLALGVTGGSQWMEKRGGILAPDGTWRSHYWLSDGRIIVDLTADQFGYDPVIVTEASDDRYRQTYSKRDIVWHSANVDRTVSRWQEAFQAKTAFMTALRPEENRIPVR